MAADFIAVIEAGSERVNGIAGVRNAKGGIDVKAAVSADASAFVECGMIYNLNQAATCFTAIVRGLEASLHTHIEKVYTAVEGLSLHTVTNSITRTLTSKTEISKEFVETIEDKNRDSFRNNDEWECLETISQEYKTREFEQLNPVGIVDDRIEGRFLNILARKEVRKNLQESFRKAGITLAGIFTEPLVLAKALLTDKERSAGVALVDFQYDTTTISIYQRNILRHLAVLPLGEKNVILDIQNVFNTDETEARELLWKYGNAYYEDIEADNNKVIARADGNTISRKEFNETVEARFQEIIANLWQQIAVSGFNENQLRNGVVFTGPVSEFKNIDKAFQQYMKSNVKVRIQTNLIVSVTDLSHCLGTNCNAALAILLEGKENCAGETQKDLFGHAEKEEEKEEHETPDPEEIRRQLEAERREREFLQAMDDVTNMIQKKKFRDAEKKLNGLRSIYPEKEEIIENRFTALNNAKGPGFMAKWKKHLEDYFGNVLGPEK